MGGGLAVEVEGALGSEGSQGGDAGGAGREQGQDEGKRGAVGGRGGNFVWHANRCNWRERNWRRCVGEFDDVSGARWSWRGRETEEPYRRSWESLRAD
jgi:hypothetical protein